MFLPIKLMAVQLCAASLGLAALTAQIPNPLPTGQPMVHPSPKPAAKPIDANHATREALLKLPGLDAAAVDKIIKGRPYLSKAQLFTQGALTRPQYETIRTRVYVTATNEQAMAKAKPKPKQ